MGGELPSVESLARFVPVTRDPRVVHSVIQNGDTVGNMSPAKRTMTGVGRLLGLACLALLASVALSGCGSKPGYPTAKPVAVLDQPGECAYCRKKIERVTEDNLLTYDGVQYIVCSEECAAKQKIAAER
jgi:hypothetical protein